MTRIPSGHTRWRAWILRGIAVAIALPTLAFSVRGLPATVELGELRRISDRVLEGQAFSDDVVVKLKASLTRGRPLEECGAASEDMAVLHVFMAGLALRSPEAPGSRAAVAQADRALRAAISCSPSRSLLWFLLFWLESRDRLEAALPYLRLSYAFGRAEGWIAPARGRAALAFLDRLPPDLQAEVRAEFLRLARDDVGAAVQTFVGTDDGRRRQLLTLLEQLPLQTRTEFARRLEGEDIDVKVPGVDRPERR